MKNKTSAAEKVRDAAIKILTKQKETLQKQLEEAKYNKSMSMSVPESLAYSTEIAVLTKKLDDLQKDIDSFLKTADRIIRQKKAAKSNITTNEAEMIVLPIPPSSPMYDDTLRFVTKIPSYKKNLYENAIKEYGSQYLVIRNNILYCRGYRDLSGFWKLVHNLQAEFDTYTEAIADFFNREKNAVEDFENEVQEGFEYEIAISNGTTEQICAELTADKVARCIYSGKGYIMGYETTEGHPRGFQKFTPGADVIVSESCYENKTTEYPIKDIVEAYKNTRQAESHEKENPEYE